MVGFRYFAPFLLHRTPGRGLGACLRLACLNFRSYKGLQGSGVSKVFISSGIYAIHANMVHFPEIELLTVPCSLLLRRHIQPSPLTPDFDCIRTPRGSMITQAAIASRAFSSATRSAAAPAPAWALCSSPRRKPRELCNKHRQRVVGQPSSDLSRETRVWPPLAGARGAPWIAQLITAYGLRSEGRSGYW